VQVGGQFWILGTVSPGELEPTPMGIPAVIDPAPQLNPLPVFGFIRLRGQLPRVVTRAGLYRAVEAGVTPTRILVADGPAPLRAAVHSAVTGEPDLELVEISGGEIEMLLLAAEAHADLVVVAMTARTLPPLAERLLDENPQLAVLAVDLDRAEGLLHRVRPDTMLIQDLSADGLTAILRRAATGHARLTGHQNNTDHPGEGTPRWRRRPIPTCVTLSTTGSPR
jgi:hypothetical protein